MINLLLVLSFFKQHCTHINNNHRWVGAQPSNGSTKDGCNKANSKHYPQVTRSIYSSPLCNPTRPFTARDSSTCPTPANHSKFLRCHGKKLRYPGPKLYPQKSHITCTHVTLTLPAQKRQGKAADSPTCRLKRQKYSSTGRTLS